jgi:phosphatidylserine/phosphatidylglycerophosphate/cardiolipin synthase-like enzyme
MTTKETLRATDIHREWKRAVSSASLSVRVFTPYFDRLLPQLLKGAKQRGLTVAVVTDLSPTGGQDYPAQLRAAKRLLKLGISLKTLPRLHAKVLQVDRDIVGLGSQNFTTYARSSRETSIIPMVHYNEARFLEQLDQWAKLANVVDLAMVEALSDRLTNAFRVLAKQEAELHTQYDQIIAAEQRKRWTLSIQARLRSAAAASTVTLAESWPPMFGH